MTSTRDRHHRSTSTLPPAGRVPLRGAAVCAALSLFVLTACEAEDHDKRPASDYEALVDGLRALPGVESVAPAATEPATATATTATGSATGRAYTVVLDPESGEAELRTVGKRSHTLVNDHAYPSGAPEVTVEYGQFTAEIPQTRPEDEGAVCADACGPDRIDLTDFLDLRALPETASGSLTPGGTTVVLAQDQDRRAWVEEALATDVRTRLIVHTAEDPKTRWLIMSLGADGTAERVRSVFDLADANGADVVEVAVEQQDEYQAEHQSVILRVDEPADIPAVHDAVVAGSHRDADGSFDVVTDDGFEMPVGIDVSSIEEGVEAHRLLTDAGATVHRVSGGEGGRFSRVSLTAPDSEVLRSVVDLVSDAAWPLPQDASVRVQHEDSLDHRASFDAHQWEERAPLLTDLWDAGLTDVSYRNGYEGADTILEIGPDADFATPAGRDALITTLRDVGWEGTAQITLASGDMPSFTTTADGRAQDPHNTAPGAEDAVYGWGQDFIDAWDDSAA